MLKLFTLALLFGAASAGASNPAAPLPLCRVVAIARPEQLPGLYTVTVRVTATLGGAPCGVDGYALVQFDGGRKYPLSAVRAGEPYMRFGIPWYWRLYWTASSGKRYPVPLIGMHSPFNTSP